MVTSTNLLGYEYIFILYKFQLILFLPFRKWWPLQCGVETFARGLRFCALLTSWQVGGTSLVSKRVSGEKFFLEIRIFSPDTSTHELSFFLVKRKKGVLLFPQVFAHHGEGC